MWSCTVPAWSPTDAPRRSLPEVFEGSAADQPRRLGQHCAAQHPTLPPRDHGHLVLVGSVIGHIAVPSMSPYVLSKWGVRALARQLEVENLDRSGVHISYAAPGWGGHADLRAGGQLRGIGRPYRRRR